MTLEPMRNQIVARLRQDLIGPLTDDEVLADRPTQRYSTGILYPRGSRIEAAEDEDGGVPTNGGDETQPPDDPGVSLHSALKPSAAGLSFAVKASDDAIPTVHFRVSCAWYRRVGVNATGQVTDEKPSSRAQERWRRMPLLAELPIRLETGENRTDLGEHGLEGMELYVLVTPHTGLLTVTAALSNQRLRGESSAFDEEQHRFQVALTAERIVGGHFAPRPSIRAATDEDARTAALIYRDVKEYVVGHTCSATASLAGDGVKQLSTDWMPAAAVPAMSDKGDEVFDVLRTAGTASPLRAQWLSEASAKDLGDGLSQVVGAYEEWIAKQRQRVDGLPAHLKAQARKQLDVCGLGAKRMAESVDLVSRDPDVRRAFQLAQAAMAMQFRWTRSGDELVWRPFQLAFQLLVLPSLASRGHDDRSIMDLLWFPTGGGKTEAYLALTAFTIVLRRLRTSASDDGLGVAVLMRYTLRLLTVQQFQRAAAMIMACEVLRRRECAKGSSRLADAPVGIGLWVGGTTTPLTLREALDQPPGAPSTPEQLPNCPCCGGALDWRLTPKESIVECRSGASCEFASTGSRLPLWTIDEEVYRHAPSLVIGTVDKFAQVVRNLDTRVLFGRVANRFPPDLIIQDELHLISGPLGSIAGLYEVAIDELCRRGSVRPKIVGSTATIRRAQEQIEALFDRQTYQFPAPGLDASNSGFAVADPNLPGRLYVGVTTVGRSATYMLQALVASLLQAATDPNVSDSERDYYWTLVTYFGSLRELGRALVLMQDDVPVSIGQFASRRGEARRHIEAPAELTSRVRSYEIRDMLARLAKNAGDPEAVDLLLASNMISVGMDIPRLGLMLVNAQPKTLSEYIQATSRVGRGRVPGLVITMYNSMRARDRSHYESFETWHRFLYRDVEATSVTPFASRAQDKALHAVLVALVRHTVPGMDRRPILDDIRRRQVEAIAATIEGRVNRVDSRERATVSQKLTRLIDEWSSRQDLQAYWDDYGRQTSLLISAEQFAALADVDGDLDADGARRALWPTPNSMREVEAGTPYVLRQILRTETNN